MNLSMFGEFLSADSAILRLMDDMRIALDVDHEVYMLGGGNPAQIPEVQAFFRERMRELLSQIDQFDQVVGKYDGPQGNSEFLEAIAELLCSQYKWPISAENVVITNGSQSSLFVLFNMFAGEYRNDQRHNILLPLTPEYIGYREAGLGHNIFYSYRPSIEQRGEHIFKYHIDFENLGIRSNTGAICVSRPTNPTGNVLTDSEIRRLHRLANDNEIPLIIDSAYGAPFPNIVFSEIAPIWDSNVIVCLSLSKIGLPGVRTGIVIAQKQIIQALTSSNAILSLAPGSFGPALVTRAIQSGELINLSNTHIRPYYERRAKEAISWFEEEFKGYPCRAHAPEGAIFLWFWFQNLPISSEELYQRLKRRDVIVIAGQHFFPGLEEDWQHRQECIRVSYAQEPVLVRRGITIIGEEVRAAYGNRTSGVT